jgi:hypothetical protein
MWSSQYLPGVHCDVRNVTEAQARHFGVHVPHTVSTKQEDCATDAEEKKCGKEMRALHGGHRDGRNMAIAPSNISGCAS